MDAMQRDWLALRAGVSAHRLVKLSLPAVWNGSVLGTAG